MECHAKPGKMFIRTFWKTGATAQEFHRSCPRCHPCNWQGKKNDQATIKRKTAEEDDLRSSIHLNSSSSLSTRFSVAHCVQMSRNHWPKASCWALEWFPEIFCLNESTSAKIWDHARLEYRISAQIDSASDNCKRTSNKSSHSCVEAIPFYILHE